MNRDVVDPRPVRSVCVLAAAPFERGGIERLTWDVHRALGSAAGPDRVRMAALVGPSDGGAELAFAGPPRLSAASKARFAWNVVLDLARRDPSMLLFCMHPNQGQVALAARRLFGSRFVVWAHGAEVWGPMQALPRAALRAADLVVCSSGFTRRRLAQRHGVAVGRTVAVHPPVSAETLARAARTRRSAGACEPVILSAGRAGAGDRYKGFDVLLQALPAVRDRVANVRYVHVGGGDGLSELRGRAESIGVGDLAEFPGAVNDEALWDAFEACRVFAMPSRADADGRHPYGEGFGIVYTEAAAFGRPVVGSVDGGAAEAVLDGVTGATVDPRDPGAVAAALVRYLEDPAAADRAGAEGRRWVDERFSPAAFERHLTLALDRAGLLPGSDGASTPDRSGAS